MTEAELLEIASDRPAPAPRMFWSSHVYGVGKWLKRYVGFPDDLPLCAEIDHGPSEDAIPHQIFLDSVAPLVLFHNRTMVHTFREYSTRPCAAMGAPFPYYRWLNDIRVETGARGTLAVPTHTTHHIETTFDWRTYCRELKKLPARFQPVTVCLYWREILGGVHRTVMEEGLDVVCAGHIYDDRFVERFYRILSRHRFLTSNEVCTATWYAVEMGMPFFLWGEQPYLSIGTGGDPSRPVGHFDTAALVAYYRLDDAKIRDLFGDTLPGDLAARIAGVRNRKVEDEASFRRFLLEGGIGDGQASFLDTIVERAKIPMVASRRPELFRDLRDTITAEQRDFVIAKLGLDTARPRGELRRLLWDAFDVLFLQKSSSQLEKACRPEAERAPIDTIIWKPCPACGSTDLEPLASTPGEYPPAAGAFALCRECGTAYRCFFGQALESERLQLVPEPPQVWGTTLRIDRLGEDPDPLGTLCRLLELYPAAQVVVTGPSLAGYGLSGCRENVASRIAFTVLGIRRLLVRAGLHVLTAFQDESGRIRAAARPGKPVRQETPVPPFDVVDRSRRLLRGDAPPPLPMEESAKVMGLASLPIPQLSDLHRSACFGRLFESLRAHPDAAEVHMALAIVHIKAGEFETGATWLGLYTELVGAAAHPSQELGFVHHHLGIDDQALGLAEAA